MYHPAMELPHFIAQLVVPMLIKLGVLLWIQGKLMFLDCK
jgi:hypothetical protein